MITRRSLLAAGCGLLAAPALPTRSFAATRRVVDALGRTVDLPARIDRVVVNFNFEEFTAVAGTDGWSKVVGMSKTLWSGWRPAIWSRYTPLIPNLADMPEIGNTDDNSFNVEQVIALKPDVVLLAEWSWKVLETQRAQMEKAGIPIVVIDYNAQSLERHLASTRAIGAVIGREDRAEDLARLYEAKYREIMERIASAGAKTRARVHFELGRDGADKIGNSYSGTMWGKIANLLGTDNIADGKLSGPWGPLSAETVLAADPDHIFIAGSSWVGKPNCVKTGYGTDLAITRASLAPYAARPGWADLKAAVNGEIHAIEHGLCRTLFDYVAMQYIAKRLHPAAFADVDPVRSFADYHAKFLPVAFSGTWMASLK